MDEKYKIFNDLCNEVLNFVEFIDEDLIEDYKKIIDELPQIIIKKIKDHKGFSHKVNGIYYSESLEGECMFSFKCSKFPSPEKKSILFQPFTQDFIKCLSSNEDGHCLIFRLVNTNKRSEPTLKINFEEKDGVMQYMGTEINGIEIDYDVYIHKVNNQLFLTSKKCFNWNEVYCKKEELSIEELEALNTTIATLTQMKRKNRQLSLKDVA
jgi:hypothetical protein